MGMTAPALTCKSAGAAAGVGQALFGMLPADRRADMILSRYVKSPGNHTLTPRELRMLYTPGTISAIHRIVSSGKHAPGLFKKEIGGGAISSTLSHAFGNRIGGGIVANAALERLLPRIEGSTDLAKACLEAGGVV